MTAIWFLWIVALVALALMSLRGADLHWRHRLAPGGVRQGRLADALVVGTLRWLVVWFGGCALVAGALWLLLTDAGAAARQQGALAIAVSVGSSASVLLLEVALAVVIAVWLRALSPRPEPVLYGAFGVFVLGFAVYGWAALTAPFNARPPFDDPALVIGSRDVAHGVGMVAAIAAVLLLARWQWRRVDWLGQHLARRTSGARSGDDT